jgi:hypothetical protein
MVSGSQSQTAGDGKGKTGKGTGMDEETDGEMILIYVDGVPVDSIYIPCFARE